jgi:hypothetical protein
MEGAVKSMLYNAIMRNLPSGWNYQRHEPGPTIQYRVEDTVYYFRRSEPGRGYGGSAGWDNILTLVDGDESLLQYTAQGPNPKPPFVKVNPPKPRKRRKKPAAVEATP